MPKVLFFIYTAGLTYCPRCSGKDASYLFAGDIIKLKERGCG